MGLSRSLDAAVIARYAHTRHDGTGGGLEDLEGLDDLSAANTENYGFIQRRCLEAKGNI